jgi:hypothetical protein
VGNTALQRDRCEFSQTRRLATAARIASLAMLNNFRRTPQSTDSANASYVAAIPFDAELKVLVGIKTLRIDSKFSHDREMSQLASRAYQSTLRVTYITIASTMKSAIAPMSNA